MSKIQNKMDEYADLLGESIGDIKEADIDDKVDMYIPQIPGISEDI